LICKESSVGQWCTNVSAKGHNENSQNPQKIKIIPLFYKQGRKFVIALNTVERLHHLYVYTVKVSVMVMPQLGNERCPIFFILYTFPLASGGRNLCTNRVGLGCVMALTHTLTFPYKPMTVMPLW